jgi:hypothetical protein
MWENQNACEMWKEINHVRGFTIKHALEEEKKKIQNLKPKSLYFKKEITISTMPKLKGK